MAIVVVVFVGCLFQASVGFGGNVVAQPVVFLIGPTLVPGPVLLTVGLLNILVIGRERQRLQRGPLGWAALGMVGGTGVAVVTIGAVSGDGLAIVIAVSVLVMVASMASTRLELPRSRLNIATAGALGGFAGTTAGIDGPPMALLFQRAVVSAIRGFLATYFILSTAVALIGLSIAGRFGANEAADGLLLFPVAVVAFVLSRPLLPIVDRGRARPLILTASTVAAIILLGRTILS